MRVAFLVPSLGRMEGQGGANLELLRRVARAGHTVDAFTGSAPESVETIPGVRVRKLPRLPAWQFGNQLLSLTASSAKLRAHTYDVVHADAGVTLRRADVVVCHTITDRWYDLEGDVRREGGVRGLNQAAATRFKASLELRQYRAARAVIANSRSTAEDLVARGVERDRIVVMQFGVDSERFRPPTRQERDAARASFGIPRDAYVVGFVGAHGPRKGLPVALDSLAAAAPGEHLLVAGEHRGGRWARDAAERALPAVMPGKLADVRSAYWAADVLAYPSLYDSFGLAVLEAMACGLPVVVSREAGSHEIVRDAGFVLAEPTAGALRGALDALRSDQARRSAMGERARAIALTHTWDKAGDILLSAYEDAADRAPRRAIPAL